MPRVFSPEQLAKGIKGFGDKALEDLAGREQDIQRGKTVELLRRAGKEMYENPIVNTAIGLSPVLGDIQAGVEAYRSAQEGDWGNAGLNAMGMLPFIPMLGGMTKVGKLANEAPQAQALREAEEYGQKMLGLPPGNTPMDRAAFYYNEPLYTGTRSDITELNPNMGSGAREGTGIWTSKDPMVANTYAGNTGGNVMPLMARTQSMGEVYAGGNNWGRIPAEDTVIRHANDTDSAAIDYIDPRYDDYIDTNDLARISRKEGDAGLIISDVKDPGGHMRGVSEMPETADNVVIFDPSQVRSKFAAFDPRYFGKPGLMLGAGGLGVYGALQGEGEYK